MTEFDCPVCLEFLSEDKKVTMNCSHFICNSCLYQTLDYEQRKCPLCRQDYSNFACCYTEATQNNNPMAYRDLGKMYLDGYATHQNYQEALKWLQKAADLGHGEAAFLTGYMYHYGKGCIVDLKQAFNYYGIAAQQGDIDAQVNLSYFLQRGMGCDKNPDLAFFWGYQAANSGDSNAQNNLAFLYILGMGCSKNLTEAKKWATLSANQGNSAGKKNLEEILKMEASINQKIIDGAKKS